MRAVVLIGTGPASSLAVSEVPVPQVRPGWLLVRVTAFGINRAEVVLRSREADAPYIRLPRIPGIECVGIVADPSDSGFRTGQRVLALMGGMGRSFDGSYAEFALLPTSHVFAVPTTDLDSTELAAVPETFFTAWGALYQGLRLTPGDSLLVRGGTSALGIAAIQLAKAEGCTVLATTRNASKLEFLDSLGVDLPLLDDAGLAARVRGSRTGGVSRILELVGPATLESSLSMLGPEGGVCCTGQLGGHGTLRDFDPIKSIPNGTFLTSFYSNAPSQPAIEELFQRLRRGGIRPVVSATFPLEEIGSAHELMESDAAQGKIVIVVDSGD